MNTITITDGTIACIIVTIVLLVIVPLAFALPWKLRHKDSATWKWFIAGAVGFIVSARVLEALVHMVCIVLDNPVSRFINGNTWAYVLYGCVMAGVFEECGRYIVIDKFLKTHKTRENAVMYGIGHGGIEVWAVLLVSMISYLSIALTIQSTGLEATLSTLGVTEDQLDAVMPTLEAIAGYNAGTVLLTILERVVAMFAHISFTVIVFYGIHTGKKVYLLYAILAHMAVDVFAALYQRGAVSMVILEVWATACAGLLTLWAVKLYRECKVTEEAEETEEQQDPIHNS